MGQAPSLLEVVKTSGSDKAAITNISNLIQQYKTQIDINAANDDGKTALHLAAEQGLAEVVVLLLENGADPTKTDNQLCTPLMNAVFIGNSETAEALLTTGKTDINAVNKDGMTSLHWAILRRHYECVELLIRRGASLELKNSKGQTPIDMVQSLKPKQREKMDEFIKQCLSGASPTIPANSSLPTPSKSGSNSTTRSNSVSSAAQISAATKSAHVRKLFALCKVWGLVKFIHPYFIHKDIDWDEALVNTIPKMVAAENTQEYKTVVNQLLSVLGDPNTRCSEVEEPLRAFPDTNVNQDREQPYTTVTDDGIAILMATAHDKFQDYSRMLNFLNCFKDISPIFSARSSHATIFDLRLRKGGVPLNSAAGPFKYMFFEAMKIILHQDIHLPCYRQRVFSGFPQQRNFGNIFQSGVLTLEGETLSPPPNVEGPPAKQDKHRKWIFIINKGTPDSIVDLLSALQPEGLASVIYDKHDKEPLIELGIPSIQINIGDNLSVTVRKSERLNYDGTVGFQPDVVIHSSPNDVDAALQSALEIARGIKKVDFAHRPTSPLYIKKPVELEYSQMAIPTKEYRLLGLFRFWNIVQYFYPYKNLLDREWDEVLAEFIPKMEEADTAIDYALTVAELVSNIKDSHGNCSSALLSSYIGTHIPPLEVKFIEGQTVVTHLYDPAIKQTHNMHIGDVVLSVNGEPIDTRRTRLSQLMSASTPQALQWKIHQKVLAGEKDSVVELELYTPGTPEASANKRKVTFTRNLLPVAKSPTRPSYGVLPEGYGFIDTVALNPFEVEKAMETIKDTPALILDIRGYPKGTIYAIAPRLTTKKVDVAITQTPYLQPSMLFSELESCVIEETHRLQPSTGWKYKGKVVVLISEETISHAEHSCLYLEAATDVTFVGTPTNGANGNVTNCYLPGGILVAFTGLGTQHADKSQLQRKGIQPQIRVDPSIEAIKNSQDIVLEAAVRYLKNHFAIKEVANTEKNGAAPTTTEVETPKSPSPKAQPASQNGTPTTQRKV